MLRVHLQPEMMLEALSWKLLHDCSLLNAALKLHPGAVLPIAAAKLLTAVYWESVALVEESPLYFYSI